MPAPWTRCHLPDVADAAEGRPFGAVQEARFATAELGARETGVALQRVKPGCRQAFAHRHEAAEEVYVVLSGRGRMKLDDEVIEVGPLDAVRVSPRVGRAFEAGDEGLQLLVFGPYRKGDGEILEGDFWGDGDRPQAGRG